MVGRHTVPQEQRFGSRIDQSCHQLKIKKWQCCCDFGFYLIHGRISWRCWQGNNQTGIIIRTTSSWLVRTWLWKDWAKGATLLIYPSWNWLLSPRWEADIAVDCIDHTPWDSSEEVLQQPSGSFASHASCHRASFFRAAYATRCTTYRSSDTPRFASPRVRECCAAVLCILYGVLGVCFSVYSLLCMRIAYEIS